MARRASVISNFLCVGPEGHCNTERGAIIFSSFFFPLDYSRWFTTLKSALWLILTKYLYPDLTNILSMNPHLLYPRCLVSSSQHLRIFDGFHNVRNCFIWSLLLRITMWSMSAKTLGSYLLIRSHKTSTLVQMRSVYSGQNHLLYNNFKYNIGEQRKTFWKLICAMVWCWRLAFGKDKISALCNL